MSKKEENLETCNCGHNHWEWRILGVSISALWTIFSIITCIIALGALIAAVRSNEAAQKSYEVSKKSLDISILSAGGEENFNRMNKVYESEAYLEYATSQAEQAESYFGLNNDSTDNSADNNDTNNEDTDENDTNGNTYNFKVVAWGDEIKTTVEDMLTASPSRWDENARFTIVEYTELHCPYCQRHSQEGTINSTIEQFPGEVNSISKHFIIHGEDALNLAAAMECISELKSDIYHETFEKAFEAYPVNMDGLINIATGLGVDETSLKTCIDEWRYTQAVEDMMNQGNKLFGVSGTPWNVIIDRETGNYVLVSGAYPLDAFIEAVNLLKNA